MQPIRDEVDDSRRHLALDGMWNVRDLGGYSTSRSLSEDSFLETKTATQ